MELLVNIAIDSKCKLSSRYELLYAIRNGLTLFIKSKDSCLKRLDKRELKVSKYSNRTFLREKRLLIREAGK